MACLVPAPAGLLAPAQQGSGDVHTHLLPDGQQTVAQVLGACYHVHFAEPCCQSAIGGQISAACTPPDDMLSGLQTGTMMWRQIYNFAQAAMLNCLAHPWPVRIWAIAGASARWANRTCIAAAAAAAVSLCRLPYAARLPIHALHQQKVIINLSVRRSHRTAGRRDALRRAAGARSKGVRWGLAYPFPAAFRVPVP
jgi:hypothetical protein